MAITITDPALLTQLAQSDGLVEVKDPNGHVIGTFMIEHFAKKPLDALKSPFTHEEMAERRKRRFGRPLKDIIRDLEERFRA